jgi:hypothetical protein
MSLLVLEIHSGQVISNFQKVVASPQSHISVSLIFYMSGLHLCVSGSSILMFKMISFNGKVILNLELYLSPVAK